MCGRYQLDIKLDSLLHRYGIIDTDIDFSPQPEVFPSNEALIVLNGDNKGIRRFKWGFAPSFAKNLIINARSETVDTKLTFKDAFLRRRCLIPANGFFEWYKKDGKSIKYRIHIDNQEIFSMAGIYNEFKDKNGQSFNAFTILTTEANKDVKKIHSRMPVILDKSDEDIWIDNSMRDLKALKSLLRPYDGDMNLGL